MFPDTVTFTDVRFRTAASLSGGNNSAHNTDLQRAPYGEGGGGGLGRPAGGVLKVTLEVTVILIDLSHVSFPLSLLLPQDAAPWKLVAFVFPPEKAVHSAHTNLDVQQNKTQTLASTTGKGSPPPP